MSIKIKQRIVSMDTDIRIYSRFLLKKQIFLNVTIFFKLFVGYWHVFMSWIWPTPKRGKKHSHLYRKFSSSGYSFYAAIFMLKVLNKLSWQINDVLYFSFDIQANYNILSKIIICMRGESEGIYIYWWGYICTRTGSLL